MNKLEKDEERPWGKRPVCNLFLNIYLYLAAVVDAKNGQLDTVRARTKYKYY